MEDASFVAALTAAPEDDATRLVYADWLEERDDPRGAWLRVATAVLNGLRLAVPGGRADPAMRSAHLMRLCPLVDLQRHGGTRAVRLLSALALRDRIRYCTSPGLQGQLEALRRAGAVAELYACGLVGEPERERAKIELRAGPSPWGRLPGLSHAYVRLAHAAFLALRQWRCCSFVLELLASSVRRTAPGPATFAERARDAELMRAQAMRHLALAERLAVAVGRRPDWRSLSSRLWAKVEGCDHQGGAAYEPRPFGRRCRRCGHFTEGPEASRGDRGP